MQQIVIKTLLRLILILLFVGCGKEEIEFPHPSEDNYDGAFSKTTQKIMVGESEYSADLITLTVKENRSDQNPRLINIPIIRVHAGSGRSNIPIFYLTGGPGMSNIHNFESMWYLMHEYDVVIVGFRGVDGSSQLDCPEVSEAMKGIGDLLSDESMDDIRKAWKASADRLNKEGVDLDGYTILEVIEDNELARKLLGYEKINLASGSYGTRVAYYYGLLHPEVINRSVLQAVNPPGRFVWEPETIDSQLRYYSELWSKDSLMSKLEPDLYNTTVDVLSKMPDNWYVFPIDKGKVKIVIFSLFFSEQSTAMVFNSFLAAKNGDYSGLALMSLIYDLVFPNMSNWGDLASKAVSVDYDVGRDRDYRKEMSTDKFPFGSPLSMLLWGSLDSNTWPIKQIPSKFDTVQFSDVETLLLSGSIDLGTPAEFATNELLPKLKNGKQIILKECGHMDYDSKHGENVRKIITSYYKTGIPDVSLNKEIPLDFQVSIGFPTIAKIIVTVILIVLILFGLFIYWIFKIFKRKYRVKQLVNV